MQQNFDDPFGEETLDLQKLIKKYLHLWPWFILSLALAFGLAWLNNAYQHNIYSNNLTLLITEEEPLLQLDNTVGSTFSVSSTRIKNEIGIINSRTLILKTINSLDFSVEYHLRNSFLDHEVYPNNYFRVEIDSIWPQPINAPILFSRNDDGTWKISAQWENAQLYSMRNQNYLGQTGKSDIELNVPAGEWVEQPHIRFRVNENPNNLPIPGQQFIVYFRDINTLASRYLGLNVEEIQNSTMLRMSILGNNRQKNAAFLNKHAETFLQRELDKKNFRAQKTIDFIDEQLALVSQSLSNSESSLEDFRTEGQILNLDYQAQQSFSRLESLQQQRTNLTIKRKYYQYLENYLKQVGENGSDLIAPSSLGIDDPLLSELIMELIQRYTERSEVMINSRRDNPFIANLESRIEITKNTIKESLSNVMQSNTMAMADLEERIADLSSKISTIPESQRHLFNIERQFTLHDNLFTFLQNKKSDIEITKAGFTPVHEIIDASNSSDGRLVSPKKRMTYYIAGFAGLLVPVLLIFLYEFFNDRIRANEDIERITNYPILGYISRNGIKQNHLVSFDKPSIQAESFRSIRTNAQFILPTHDVPIIMFTSTLLEEGKTFASLNMAVGYASMGKKAVLLSFDLRKPKLFKYLETDVELGLSNYLSSNIDVKDIIRKGPVENLDILFSGQIPPNPAELLNSPRMSELFDYLKSQYDIILIDTPPVGMVADSLLLVNYCNAIIYLVRHNRTPVKYLQQTLRNLKEKDIKNLNIVLNDIPPPGRFSSYNAYGYQYGYFEKEPS